MEMIDRFDFAKELSENVRSRFYISGEWCLPRSAERLELVSTLTEQIILSVPAGSKADMADAVAAAAHAFEAAP